jgi:glycosyltransferase involved in cell wall biosynthesis
VISLVVISRDEPALHGTLSALAQQTATLASPTEVIVVDASEGQLDWVRDRHPDVRWIPFERPAGVRASIPHQRNRGVREARGDVIVFTDCGCMPQDDWLVGLLDPILHGDENVTAGSTRSTDGPSLYDSGVWSAQDARYLAECPTINVAFRKEAFELVGGFDESFEYGSDIDFSWRLVESGLRIRSVPDAIVGHDWGGHRRQLRRGYLYGRSKVTLYGKHRGRLRSMWRTDPIVIAYPAFLLGLPLALRYKSYLALLAIPMWRNRKIGPIRAIIDHLAFGAGVLSKLAGR